MPIAHLAWRTYAYMTYDECPWSTHINRQGGNRSPPCLHNELSLLLHQHHFSQAHEVAGLDLIEIHTRRKSRRIKCHGMYSRRQHSCHDCRHFLTERIEDLQAHISCLRECKLNGRARVERIRIVLAQLICKGNAGFTRYTGGKPRHLIVEIPCIVEGRINAAKLRRYSPRRTGIIDVFVMVVAETAFIIEPANAELEFLPDNIGRGVVIEQRENGVARD